MIRVDENHLQELEISILVSPENQGKNIAANALAKTIKIYQNHVLNASVHPKNIASHKLFSQANFDKISETKYTLNLSMMESN